MTGLGGKATNSHNEMVVITDERPAIFGSHCQENSPNSIEEVCSSLHLALSQKEPCEILSLRKCWDTKTADYFLMGKMMEILQLGYFDFIWQCYFTSVSAKVLIANSLLYGLLNFCSHTSSSQLSWDLSQCLICRM